ncbi:MAG TPA: hypothetical protein VFZ87_03370 [Gemmatimonadales bacterium]
MTFKPALWRPIAFGLAALNLVAVGFAAGAAEPWHAAVHAGLAMAFGSWAQRLKRAPGGADRDERLEMLEDDMSEMRRELTEAQERLDFAERLLAQGREPRHLDQER